ncbi:protein phosphatase [Bacillus toyonensis]|uniref:PP2C family protein-serine/threonine phosphatase n=1 Tax=Bacillus toyonensis TaxID=155322 RepID=UPI000BFD358A|nr:protein phosphatase 2C domain-containing protein [Bacillus toyonensis]PHE64170.1 protein phosphatase [Bacillus toyonensis]
MFNIKTFTDIGVSRDNNEDNLMYIEGEFQNKEVAILVVCDGMGGLDDGEYASKTVCKKIEDSIVDNDFETIIDLRRAITIAIKNANTEIFNINAGKKKKSGTTISCALLADKGYFWHVGDSRIYKIKDSTVEQVTTDHTLVNRLIEDGTITEEQAKTHPERNVLTKAVGVFQSVKVQTSSFDYKDSTLVLCSDGFWHSIKDEEFVKLASNELALKDLFNLCVDRGETDNVTSIYVKHES